MIRFDDKRPNLSSIVELEIIESEINENFIDYFDFSKLKLFHYDDYIWRYKRFLP